jgi:hypothetical protein
MCERLHRVTGIIPPACAPMHWTRCPCALCCGGLLTSADVTPVELMDSSLSIFTSGRMILYTSEARSRKMLVVEEATPINHVGTVGRRDDDAATAHTDSVASKHESARRSEER